MDTSFDFRYSELKLINDDLEKNGNKKCPPSENIVFGDESNWLRDTTPNSFAPHDTNLICYRQEMIHVTQ